MTSMTVLVIEDDAETREHVIHAIASAGHVVESAADGATGLAMARAGGHAALVVDRMLPQLDGLSLVKALRGEGMQTPVLFLTTMSGIDDRVAGLEAGADDYLVKPFASAELLARVHAMTRRNQGRATRLTAGTLVMDLIERSVERDGQAIELQAQEFKLLEYFMRNAERMITRTMLLENVWNLHFDPRTTLVETHISRLRSKIGGAFIHTVRGEGYVFRAG
jgi:two-component system OmpR family response regulator